MLHIPGKELTTGQLRFLYPKEVFALSQKDIGIADMQCWVFRKAQRKWNISPSQCAQLFRKYDLFGFISECYDLLHVSSYERVLDDIEDILRRKGVVI
jgi:hypothetical protein